MPTVFRAEGFEGSFYSNEGNEPPHVHVRKGGGEAKFWLSPVDLAASAGLKIKELARAEELVTERQAAILRKWHEYFEN